MKHRRPVLSVSLLTATAAVGLAACSSGTSTASNTAAHAAANTSAVQTTGAASTAPASTSTSTAAQTTHPSGGCSSIDQQTAESILGFATAPGISSPASRGGGSGMKKIDGCVYESKTNGSLGYDVVQVNAQVSQAMIAAARGRMAQAGAQLTKFDTGLPNSIAFTQHLPFGVDSQVTVVSGDRFITVASTRKDGNVAKSQASATAAAKKLA